MFGFPFTGMFTFLFIVFICLIIYKAFKADSRQLQNNWSQYLDGMRFQTLEFYERLQKELKLCAVEDLEIEQVSLSEGGLMSSNRLYLRVSWQDFQYDVCFAPFGNSACFISWWLWRTPSGLELIFSAIPIFGAILNRIFFPETYYRIDSANSFMNFAQSKVLKIMDEIIKEQNITALPEFERYPMKQSIHKQAK